MKKVYKKPEFEVICQNQANAKFFVASMENDFSNTQTTSTQATQFETESNQGEGANNTLNNAEGNGFSF